MEKLLAKNAKIAEKEKRATEKAATNDAKALEKTETTTVKAAEKLASKKATKREMMKAKQEEARADTMYTRTETSECVIILSAFLFLSIFHSHLYSLSLSNP